MATDKQFTTKTASLRATKIDTSKITLRGKNILDYISDSEFNSYDVRDPQLKNDELDIWNTKISLSEEGHIEVKPFEHTYYSISSTQKTTLKSAVKVIDNKVLGDNDEHIMYWQTDGLTNSKSLFYYCTNLTTFSSNLSNLTYGDSMFQQCSNLTTFSSDLSNLTSGYSMFNYCTNLESFSSALPRLTDGSYMFSSCYNLKSFSSDLSNLTSGYGMFNFCTNLESFSSALPRLTDGYSMFYNCKLDAKSVANIIHTLPTLETSEDTEISIGIGCDNTEADQLLFAQECDCETWQELLDDFSAKNWTVSFQCNGRPTTTYNMRRGETLPIYAKLEEVTDEKRAHYTSTDGSKFYNIKYFHSTNGSTEGYDVFSSLDEAIETFGVIRK